MFSHISYMMHSQPLHSLRALSFSANRCRLCCSLTIMHFSTAVSRTIMRCMTPADNTHSACRWKPMEKHMREPLSHKATSKPGRDGPHLWGWRSHSAFICKSLKARLQLAFSRKNPLVPGTCFLHTSAQFGIMHDMKYITHNKWHIYVCYKTYHWSSRDPKGHRAVDCRR